MTAIDVTQRKLKFPPRFLPYLEKHRIFELFHECIELLVAIKPKDHLKFLRDIIPCAARKRDKPRIVFISPSSIDREKLAKIIAECLDIDFINKSYLKFLTQEKLIEETSTIAISEKQESVEEESCVCIEEETFRNIYFPGEEFQTEVYFLNEENEAELKMEKLVEQFDETMEKPTDELQAVEQPCICVCPCVEEAQKKLEEQKILEEKMKRSRIIADQNTDKTDEKEGEIGVAEEKEWDGERYELPCEPRERKKKKKNKEQKTLHYQSSEETSKTSTSDVEIQYEILLNCETAAKGWILADFPKTAEEAEKLCKLGLIPTHALRIIVNEEQEEKDREYKWTLFNWKKAYNFVPVMEINMGNRTIEELSCDLCRLLTVMPHRHAPMLPRIVLIGSRGSGVTTQAQKLAHKYGMVHVEFEVLMTRALEQNDDLAKIYKQQIETRVDPEVEAFILEKALMSQSCCNRGWILTGYPTKIDQMRMLDIIATPPNRVIFIEVPAKECFVRLYYRKFDPCLGEEYKYPQIQPFGSDSFTTSGIHPEIAARLLTHSKNNRKQVVHDIESYFRNKKEMIAYCGKTASIIDGNKSEQAVFEMIEQIIINPAPAQPPRNALVINYGINESYERLKKFRLTSGMFFNNLLLNPPEIITRL